jgi:hypothetical protein
MDIYNKMRTNDKPSPLNLQNLGVKNLSRRQSSVISYIPQLKVPTRRENSIWRDFDKWGLFITFIVAVIIYVTIFLALLDRNGIISALAAGTGGWLSTMLAFRWVWSKHYEWEHYLASLRPMFQTISFMYLILGPIPPLLGLPQYVFNYGAKDLYWVLYLASPLAFLGYEYGYELGIGKLGSQIKLPNLKTDFNFSSSLIFVTFAIVIAIYYYMSQNVGFSEAGFKGDIGEEHGEFIKACGFLFNGFAGVTIFLAFIYFKKNGNYGKIFSIFIIIVIILFSIFMHNRRMAIVFVIICLSLVQMIRKIKFTQTIIMLAGPILLIYGVTTVIRTAFPSHFDSAGVSFMAKLALSKEVLTGNSAKNLFEKSLRTDIGYRLDAFDESGAILKSHESQGIPYMWGENFLMGAYQSVPAIFAKVRKQDPEKMIINHFELADFDQVSTLFSSALADGSMLGIPIAFMIIGLIHAILWRYWCDRNKSGWIAMGTKFSYFAMMPYLLGYEDYIGSYLAVGLRYWVIYTIIFASILCFYAIFPHNDFQNTKKVY